MNLRTFVAAIAGAIVMFLLGFLFYGVLLMNFFKELHTAQFQGLMVDPPRFVFIFLWNLVWCWLIAFIFDFWATIKTFAGGLRGGAIIMFGIVLGVNFSNYAFMNAYKDSPYLPMLVYVIVSTVMGAITGGVIGLVLGKMNKD